MVAHENSRRGFRAIQASALEEEEGRLLAPASAIEALGLREGASVDAVPLP
jgi:arginine/ornithine N-succinyltransferase beta subunit